MPGGCPDEFGGQRWGAGLLQLGEQGAEVSLWAYGDFHILKTSGQATQTAP